ncbi:bifunctional phosphopantothenoylcysteine decarboxylase/phosphopantothenate--cysteine ligase CoaBC [Candidatus Pantoea edessiphila]|uniref:Coenzyme A biosynthesis bifunctional protein CoaBC n=2 Tax=Candidatus Pantoea edessiphila TaxID=2044610 RepID=A0A2P5SVK0_9GAMM|nr:bifunctional phosphopantothenoylcysteine decarboxylase/phosphopantothenate--cysteine ligase CoaBC [Candidatus Pantoea edessiphila]
MKLVSRKILLGVSGSIAAYKIPELVRRLRDHGAEIRIMITEAAKYFVTPLSLQTVSGYPISESLNCQFNNSTLNHINLARWADLIILVPATADLIARITVGMANDIVTATCLASITPIAIVPSMNTYMYHSPITQNNLKNLYDRGILIWGPEFGSQACGDNHLGRMLEPISIVYYIIKWFLSKHDLKHLNIMITAGPTHESIDPIRYITNQSSGKMGFSIASVAAKRGANVILISGPVNLPTPEWVNRINVITAIEMKEQVMSIINKQHIFIGNAAVSDYRAEKFFNKKKKKTKKEKIKLNFIKNPDIVASVGFLQEGRPFVVGFSAEINNLKKYAKKKLADKNLDLICANYVTKLGQGFNSDTNTIYLFWHKGEKHLPNNNKLLLSNQLLNEIIYLYDKKNRYENS